MKWVDRWNSHPWYITPSKRTIDLVNGNPLPWKSLITVAIGVSLALAINSI